MIKIVKKYLLPLTLTLTLILTGGIINDKLYTETNQGSN